MAERVGLEPPRFYPPDPKLRRFAGVSEAGARSRNPERTLRRISRRWCERGDSNPHGFTRQILSLVRLPIPPLSHFLINDIKGYNLCEQSFTGRTHAKHPRCRLHCGLIGRSGPATTVAGHRQSKPGPPVCRRICFSQTERALEANVTAEWEAFKKKDKKTYSDLLADDFVDRK